MTRAALLLAFAASAGWLALPWPFDPHLPAWAERWLYNPRERMDRAVEAYEQGKPKEGVAPADTALRIAGDDPLVQYDAGTVHLAAGDERQATEILEKAAKAIESAAPELAPDAFYNLGNARLAAGDATQAVEAYKQALRSEPGHADAKHNLELALRQQEKERRGASGSRQGNRGNRQGQQGSSGQQQGSGKPDDQNDPRNQQPQDPGQQQRQGQGSQGQPQQQPQQPSPNPGGDPRLPRFQNQPDMSAREAASLLQAVENLERQQRQREAARRAQQSATKEKDW